MSSRGRSRSRRNSRWNEPVIGMTTQTAAAYQSLLPRYSPYGLTLEQLEAFCVRIRIEEITRQLTVPTGQLEHEFECTRERSPSPEPIYDPLTNKRINTRDQRIRDKLQLERHALIQEAIKMNSKFKAPSDYTPVSTKIYQKIPIPVEKYPEYNFVGLIIGPRGNTQKRMEKETGAKIVIRGKGSTKEGKNKQKQPWDDEPLHVMITADTVGQVQAAAELVNELLVPMEESKNEWKKQQLRELALINGTLRERFFPDTATSELSYESANVKCSICGELSHISIDCPLRGSGPLRDNGNLVSKQEHLDSEFTKFLEDIGEAPQKDQEDEQYETFLQEISKE